jgi:hypothetical protein
MAVVASSIINRARTQLADNGSTYRWADSELLNWLSDGQRAIVALDPVATQTVTGVTLVAGTRQSLPSGAHKLIHIYRNLSAGGTPGKACTYVPLSLLDTQYPDWHTDTAVSAVRHWTYDENDPVGFYVYPRNDGSGRVELNYSTMPTDLPSTSSNISVRDIYQTALLDYVMFRAHSKDSDFAAGQSLAAGYLTAFNNFVAAQARKPE